MVEFRDYQREIIVNGSEVLSRCGFLYLAMEVRTGKTLTSLGIAERLGLNSVLFITKKKAMSSIDSDFKMMQPSPIFLHVVNYESLHKIPNLSWDLVVCDEAHTLGAFPKPSKRAKQVHKIVGAAGRPMVMLLSGTPTPESYSQMYHQVYGIVGNPFGRYKNFYRFSDDYVKVVTRPINGFNIRDYSDGSRSILEVMDQYTISFTQNQAGFVSEIEEEVLTVPMKASTYSLCRELKNNLAVEGRDEVILADTGVKLMSKLHQMYSGTVKFESGNSMVLDYSKAEFIKWKFDGQKIGIFYKFKAELEAIKKVYGDGICTDLEAFDSTDKSIALQIVSGREGISLRNAEFIVFYNIDFSATSYWQARDRMTTKDRRYNKVYWIFSENGIERKIYKAVKEKKDYTLSHFKKDSITL